MKAALATVAVGYVQDDVVGTGYVAAVTLQQKLKYTGKAYVLGSSSLAAELSQVGITAIGAGVRCRASIEVCVSLSSLPDSVRLIVTLLCVRFLSTSSQQTVDFKQRKNNYIIQ